MTVMISLWIAIIAFFLLGLNHFFPSRNAGFGLRFPFAFHTLKGWKQSQSRFYILVILLNLLIFLYSFYIDLNEIRVLGLSIISIVLKNSLIVLSVIFIATIYYLKAGWRKSMY